MANIAGSSTVICTQSMAGVTRIDIFDAEEETHVAEKITYWNLTPSRGAGGLSTNAQWANEQSINYQHRETDNQDQQDRPPDRGYYQHRETDNQDQQDRPPDRGPTAHSSMVTACNMESSPQWWFQRFLVARCGCCHRRISSGLAQHECRVLPPPQLRVVAIVVTLMIMNWHEPKPLYKLKSSQRCSTDADWSQPLCPYHNKHITHYFNIIKRFTLR